MKDFFDDFSGIVHIPGGAVEYENGVLVERKEKPLNKKPTCRRQEREPARSKTMTVTCEKIGNWTVKTNREAMKNDPANNKKERYLLQGVEAGYTLFDTVEKQFITIRGDKRWENWKAAHAGEWATDF